MTAGRPLGLVSLLSQPPTDIHSEWRPLGLVSLLSQPPTDIHSEWRPLGLVSLLSQPLTDVHRARTADMARVTFPRHERTAVTDTRRAPDRDDRRHRSSRSAVALPARLVGQLTRQIAKFPTINVLPY